MGTAETHEALESATDPLILDVRSRFVADFPLRCDTAVQLIERTAVPQARTEAAQALRTLAHRTAGLAGIIGFRRVSALASDLEDVAAQLATGGADVTSASAVVNSIRIAFAQELASPARLRASPAGQVGRGLVLVAEDDDDQRAILLRQLADAGYRTRDVASGDQVVAAARETPPSAVLLDVSMPGLDGYAVCRELKADPDLTTVPVVFMTSHGRLDERLAGLTLGADDYLVKPVDPSELIVRLERVGLRHVACAEETAQRGLLSFADFLSVAPHRLTRISGSLVLMRVDADRMSEASGRVLGEIRRADLAARLDRTHVLLFLSEQTNATARARTMNLIARLAESGIDEVVAGVACAPTAGCKPLELLMSEADVALVQARHVGTAVTLYGDPVERGTPSASATAVIADDDPDVARIVEAQFRGAGYQTTVVFDGAEALVALDDHRPDVLILDLMMPRVGGFEVLRRLKGLDGARPKIVVLSARGREDEITRAFEAGADDYVVKPFNPQELLVRVARLVR